jgi:2,3-dihydroxybiphenyl 1,2-dioxygenase
MSILSLGYVGFSSNHLEEWSRFASDLLGLEAAAASRNAVSLRCDNRAQRLFVERGSTETISCIGWEVADADALAALAARLSNAGVAVEPGSPELAAQRRVKALITFLDPLGNRLEAFYGGEDGAAPFQPARALSGFRTGAQGLGHVVLTARDAETVLPFYRDLLGFQLSDYTLRPFKAFFFHLNARHHSFAVVETGKDGFHHLLLELNALDDVGQGYDLAQLEEDRVAVTLGRHTNDFMTSFYARSPSGLLIEYGWGGRAIEPETWEPFECDYGPSFWGHERSWLTPEKRAEARDLRLGAAQAGRRAPVHVLPGQYVALRDD